MATYNRLPKTSRQRLEELANKYPEWFELAQKTLRLMDDGEHQLLGALTVGLMQAYAMGVRGTMPQAEVKKPWRWDDPDPLFEEEERKRIEKFQAEARASRVRRTAPTPQEPTERVRRTRVAVPEVETPRIRRSR